MTSRTERNTSRLPDPMRFKANLSIEVLANYVDDLVKTLRLRLEGVEGEIDYQDVRTKVLEVDSDTAIDTSTPIVLCDNAIEIELPNARDAFDDQAVVTIKARTGAVTVVPQSGENIEGAASHIIPILSSIIVVSDGDDWWITASYP